MTPAIDLSNRYFVGATPKGVVVGSCSLALSAEDALVFAAWLVVVAQMTTDLKFEDVRTAVEAS
jgi:hypothetical protein